MRKDRNPSDNQRGVSMLEVMVAASIGLIVLMATYDMIDASNRSFSRETDLAAAQNTGRVALDVISQELREAGYSPLGVQFWAISEGNTTRIRLLLDRDGDGIVGTSTEDDETMSWIFADDDGDGLYELSRGVDFNADWDFTGTGESLSRFGDTIMPIDADDDGFDDPFFSFNVDPPASPTAFDPDAAQTSIVTVRYGVRSEHRDVTRKEYPMVSFQSSVKLRNRI